MACQSSPEVSDRTDRAAADALTLGARSLPETASSRDPGAPSARETRRSFNQPRGLDAKSISERSISCTNGLVIRGERQARRSPRSTQVGRIQHKLLRQRRLQYVTRTRGPDKRLDARRRLAANVLRKKRTKLVPGFFVGADLAETRHAWRPLPELHELGQPESFKIRLTLRTTTGR